MRDTYLGSALTEARQKEQLQILFENGPERRAGKFEPRCMVSK